MKIIVNSLKVLALAALVMACNSSHLDLKPLGNTEADIFDQQVDYERAVFGVYAKMNDLYWYNNNNFIHRIWLLPGDDLTSSGTYPFEIFSTIQPGDGSINTFYDALYQINGRANVVLQKIKMDEDRDQTVFASTSLRDNMKGEALFMRGYADFMLWNYFGTSPLITERIQLPDQVNQPNSQGTELIDQAITDLIAAANLLPSSWDDANIGRVTKSSANGMLGKALVFRATWTGQAADYTSAIAAFNKITDKSLVSNYGDNFSVQHENNNESLFEFQASQAPGLDNVWLPNDFDQNVGSMSTFRGYFNANYAFYDGTPWVATQKLVDLLTSSEYANDPRVPYIIDTSSANLGHITKYVMDDQLDQVGVGSVNNERILRYADVLLLKAEALNETGDQNGAIALINQVRKRARDMGSSGEPADRATGADKSTVRSWIMQERFIELAAEGHRWEDLRRWEKAGFISLNNAFFSSLNSSINFDASKNLLLPIPTDETDRNPNIVQNPGF